MGEYIIGTGVTITETFMVNGVPTDPTTVTFYLRDPSDQLTTYVFGVDPEITNPSVGTYQVALVPTIYGHYNYRVEGTGAVAAVCEGDFDILPSPTLDVVTGAEFGPCTEWVDTNDVAACCGVEVGSDTLLFEEAAFQASQTLYELSGRKFPGSCKKTVRPCGEVICGFQVLSRGHVIWPGDGWYDGGGWGWGAGGWSWPEFNGCGCAPLDRVLLSGYPVTSIVNVKIDGVVVDPTTYRLDEFRYLTRVRAAAGDETVGWPSCQMMDLPDTEVGTFSVTYFSGVDPPALGRGAAAQLACELYKSCTGMADCVLPPGTTRATRQGITVEKNAVLTWAFQPIARGESRRGWATGLSLVDAFLNTYNPSALQRRPMVWSPDGVKYARPVGS